MPAPATSSATRLLTEGGRSDVAGEEPLDELLLSRARAGIDALVEHLLRQIREAQLAAEDVLPEGAAPAGVAIRDHLVELAVVDDLLRDQQAARERVHAADVGVEQIGRVDALPAELGVE